MGHKVKIRVTLNSGKTEKLGFSMNEGQTFRLHGEVPGMAVLAALMGDPQTPAVKMMIKNGGVVVSKSSKGPDLVVNSQTLNESKIVTGDVLTYTNGKIEFLEAPVFVEQEHSTKMIELPNSDSTSFIESPSKTKFITNPGFKVPAEKSADMPREKDDATAFIMREKAPAESRHDSWNDADYESDADDLDAPPLWQHIAISLAMIAVCGEFASLIAFGFKYTISPIPTPYSGMFLMAFFSALSYGFFYANRYFKTKGKIQDYLRSFAWFSLYLLPFAFAFGFPKSVIIFASILLGTVWVGLFSIKYFSHLPKFIPAGGVAWLFCMVVGFHTFSNMQLQTIHGNGAREIASDPSTGAVKPVEAAPQAAPVQPATPAAAPAPVQAEAPAAPLNNQEIIQQANGLALDPLAQEQFFNAVKSGNLNRVESLVERHVIDPVFTLDHGSSALHYAAAQGDLRIVKYLISKRVNIDAQDAGGTTPLMWAVYKQKPKVVEYLLQKKANPSIRREGGDRALEIARSGDDKDILAMIKDAMHARKVASLPPAKKKHH
jgi:hypothetical protein